METITEEEFKKIKRKVEELYELFDRTEKLERKVWKTLDGK